jgi:N-sulfoglucosamine sulfohydrolase
VAEIASQAQRFFSADDRPFFLVIGFADPHRAARAFANEGSYRGVQAVHYRPDDVPLPYFISDHLDARRDLADYYESISRLDQGIGMTLKVLDDSGKADQTLVIYLSDNGMPFVGAKTTLYDAGIRLPLIVRSPDVAQRGRVNDAMVSWIDIAPTVLDWCGVTLPSALPGRSFLKVLDQEHPPGWDEIYASHTFHEITMYYPMRAVRTRRYKLIWNLAHELPFSLAADLSGSPTWQGVLARKDPQMGQRSVAEFLHRPEYELYDLESDPDELHNLARDPSRSSVVADLKGRLKARMEQTGDPWLGFPR